MMQTRTILRAWLPLALSFELMLIEAPAIQGAIARLPSPTLNLAAWGLAYSLIKILESPVLMLIATGIALANGAKSLRALCRFTLYLVAGCTLLSLLLAFTPLFDLVALRLMHQPPLIVAAARPALRIMMLWAAITGWRRLCQGILVRLGETRLISLGTVIRLIATVITAVCLVAQGAESGVRTGALALMVGLVVEIAIVTAFVALVSRQVGFHLVPEHAAPTQRDILMFHMPLATVTFITLASQPLTAAALGRLPDARNTLASWIIVSTMMLVIRGWGLAFQETVVGEARDSSSHASLRRIAWCIGLISTGFAILISTSPLLHLYLDHVIKAPSKLYSLIHVGAVVGVFLPLLGTKLSLARGLLVSAKLTPPIYRAMALNLVFNATILVAGVSLRVHPLALASGALSASTFVELLYLRYCLSLSTRPISSANDSAGVAAGIA